MSFDINDIRAQMSLGGARPTLFSVQIINPANGVADIKTPFMVHAAQIPESNIGNIPVPYFGRKVNLAGDRTFDPWPVAVFNDEDFLIRNALEEWSNKINAHRRNIRGFGTPSPLAYKSTALVTQYSKTGEAIRTYKFNGLWPQNIGQIELSWDGTDTIETFQTTFQYDWWEIDESTTGNGGGA